MRVEITIAESGRVTIKAIDLTGDAWDDYLHYIAEGRRLHASNDLHGTNRALRAALVSLIAHLEGVVSGIHSELQRTRNDFKPVKPPNRKSTLKGQISDLRTHAREQMNRALPYLRLRLKSLRDILVHPTITKIDPDAPPGKQIELSELDLFDLTVLRLSVDGQRISQWLDLVCALYHHTRVHDTYKVIEDLKAQMQDLGVEHTGPAPRRI